jgi:hypothetical protein
MELGKHHSLVWYSTETDRSIFFHVVLSHFLFNFALIFTQMVGLTRPTSGTAYAHGMDIRMDMDDIYTNMGVCPQHEYLLQLITFLAMFFFPYQIVFSW